MRILFLSEGDPETWDSWSGCSRGLVRALRSLGHTVLGCDVSEPRLVRWLGMVGSWAPARRRWAARYHFGSFGFWARSLVAKHHMSTLSGQFDVLLQAGATFNALEGASVPGFVYSDANAKLTSRDAPFSETAALSRDEVAGMIEREASVYARATRVFTMSEYARRSFLHDFGLPPARVQTVFAGANLDLTILRGPRAVPAHPPTILFVGRQWTRKGGPLLLAAFREVRGAITDARLVVVGCTPGEAEDNGVEVVGPVPKQTCEGQARLSALYQTADVFCMPSQFEPFGVVFVEAMLHGVPCIGLQRCAMPEIIVHNDTGWVVENPAALRDQLIAALSAREQLREMGVRARERALQEFTWERVAQRMVSQMQAAAC